MIKDLRDARLVDAVPRVVAGQDWVRALSEAVGVLHERTLRYIDDSQIYTSLDTATEPVLDALAINWKVDWYDTGYSVEQKRRIIKTALTVRRLMGTVGAVKLQADAIYPGTMLEEWFEYGGQPGTFRLYINVTDTTEEHPAIIYSPAEMERRLITAKRWSAHLESLSYMVRHTLATGCRVDKWAYTVPECGTIYCGVWWMPATLGYTAHHFCHPYSSWERGTNENTNGMIRRRFPKGTNFAAVTNAQIAQAENWINNYPRKILGYRSSEIVFRECLRELGIAA